MKSAFLMLALVFAMSTVITACSAEKEGTSSVVKDLNQWRKMRDELKPVILTGEWHDAEFAWRELKEALNPSDVDALEIWIDLQVEIVDKTAHDHDKLLLRKLALQELEFYPTVAIKYYEWARQKHERREFTDQEMQDHLRLILERFNRIAQ